jgi:septation ring formation regulator EzrA
MSVQIESDLKEIPTRFEQRFDKLDQKLDKLNDNTTDINLRLTKVETKLDAATENIKEIKSTQKTLSTDVSDLKGSKSLIIPLVVAVTTSVLTLIIRTIPIN